MAVLSTAYQSDLLDFTIYYGAAQNTLNDTSPYAFYGPHELPFQYAPWVAWLFVPLTLLPKQSAWFVFVILLVSCLATSLYLLLKITRSQLHLPHALLLFALLLVMSWLNFRVGQTTLIQLFLVVLIMFFLDSHKPIRAGILLPISLIKPHLLLLFIPTALIAGGRKALAASLSTFILLIAASTFVNPDWFLEFIRVFWIGQTRSDVLVWDFTTLSSLLGLSRIWDIPTALILFLPSVWIVWRFRQLSQTAWLSVALTLSLFSAPYSLAYDTPLLVPALVWLSPRWTRQTAALWLGAAIIPWLSRYSSGAYLVTALVAAIVAYRGFVAIGRGYG